MHELESKIDLLNCQTKSEEFISTMKLIIGELPDIHIATAETKILAKVLPMIQDRLKQVFSDNYALFETVEDDSFHNIIMENIEASFQLVEIVQELLQFIYAQSPVNIICIESILRSLPTCLKLVTEHLSLSSESYKRTFTDELSKLIEVTKHLYSSYLIIFEQAIYVENNLQDLTLLGQALLTISQMPATLRDFDSTCITSSWRCFIAVATKYYSMLGHCLDICACINLLTEDFCRVMESLDDEDQKKFNGQVKVAIFLAKIFCKIVGHMIEEMSNICALELLSVYVKILSFSQVYYTYRNFSNESIALIEKEVITIFVVLLREMLLTERVVFKEQLKSFSNSFQSSDLFEKYAFGFLNLMKSVLGIICGITADWAEVLLILVEETFKILPSCQRIIVLLDASNGGIFQHLIVNLSAAILIHDTTSQSISILLKYLLQDNVFVSLLALEVFLLVTDNISNEENFTLLANLLYAVSELSLGVFTNRPDTVFLKCLLKKLFRKLPNTQKEEVMKLFKPEQCTEVWRILGFDALTLDLVQPVLEPIVTNTVNSVARLKQEPDVDVVIDIAENTALMATCNTLVHPKMDDMLDFLEEFWSLDLNDELMENNLMIYFTAKVSDLSAIKLHPDLIIPKLKTLIKNKSYWITVFKICRLILFRRASSLGPGALKEISSLIETATKTSPFLKDLYLNILRNLNESRTDVLNQLLDTSDASFAHQIFECIENLKIIRGVHQRHFEIFNFSQEAFRHNCLEWKNRVSESHPSKKLKLVHTEATNETACAYNNEPKRLPSLGILKVRGSSKSLKKRSVATKPLQAEDDDDTVAEVIERIKGEVKCLVKATNKEKLTAKNISHLKIVMGQLSSLM